MLGLALLAHLAFVPPTFVPPAFGSPALGAARAVRPCMATSTSEQAAVPMEHLNPLPQLAPREVVSSVMAALHRTNWEDPTPFYGFEVALRFLAPTHMAKMKRAKPSGFARFMKQPHKISQILWNEYRFEGELVLLTSDKGVPEAYQTVSLRSGPTEEWQTSRWKLVQVEFDYGSTVTPPTWLVEHVFVGEPDTAEDVEFLRAHSPPVDGASLPDVKTPKAVVETVMQALRAMDEPYKHHGAVIATRYCSPRNRASELSPAVFATYLEDPWYSILADWDEMQFDDEEDDEDGDAQTTAEIEALVRREGDDSFSVVSWMLSLYDGQWLIDSLNIIN